MKLLKYPNLLIVLFALSIIFSSCSSNSDDDIDNSSKNPAAPQINLKTTWLKSSGIETAGIQKIYEYKGSLLACTIAKGVFISNDNGTSWVSSNLGIVNENNEQLSVINTYDISGYNNSLYLITSENIFLSKDSGNNWEPTKFNTEGFPFGGFRVCAINETTVCASSGSGKFIYNRSSDSGNVWTFDSQSFGDYLKNYTVSNNAVFATKGAQGIVNSTDNGITWNSLGLETLRCNDYLVKGDFMIASTENGVFIKDNSDNWVEGNTKGLLGDSANRISTLVENNNWIFARTYDNDVFISKIIDNKIADWQKLELEGLEFIDSNMYISEISFSNGKLLIGTTDLHQEGRESTEHGKGIYIADIAL